MTIQELKAFHRQQGWLNQCLPDPIDITEALDELTDKLKRQVDLNAELICELKQLQSENRRLVRIVRRYEGLPEVSTNGQEK